LVYGGGRGPGIYGVVAGSLILGDLFFHHFSTV